MEQRLNMLRMPPIRDARYMQVVILLGYAIVAREIFSFERSHLVTLISVLWAVVLDLALGHFYYKKINPPLSAVIVALASSLLVDTVYSWIYPLVVTLGILSKALITHRGRHLFNPANFGATLVLLAAPGAVNGIPHLFGGVLLPSIIFFILGMTMVLYARQHVISLSWMAGFVVFGVIRAWLKNANTLVVLSPLIGPDLLLFTFHMISDPATTPRKPRYQIFFAFAVAALDAVMRYYEIPNSQFYSLFGICAVMPWIRERELKLDYAKEALA